MKYKIVVYQDESTEIATYMSSCIPRIGESLYFPHHGTFQVTNITYHVSDDSSKEFENDLMFVVINTHHVD